MSAFMAISSIQWGFIIHALFSCAGTCITPSVSIKWVGCIGLDVLSKFLLLSNLLMYW
jgi:hypothetical protein